MGVNKEQNQSWWGTLPGLFTGAATLITALGGFLAIYSDRCSSGTKTIQAAETPVKEQLYTPAKPAVVSSTTESEFPGRYPQASSRLLKTEDVQTFSREELKIMRNEIFARHGLIFRSEDLRAYFGSQSWYIPRSSDVSAQLTETEKRNIALIKEFERL